MYKEGVSSGKVVLDAFCGDLGARLALSFFFLGLDMYYSETKEMPICENSIWIPLEKYLEVVCNLIVQQCMSKKQQCMCLMLNVSMTHSQERVIDFKL